MICHKHQVERENPDRGHGHGRGTDWGVCVEGPSTPPNGECTSDNVLELPGARQGQFYSRARC